MYDRGIVLIRFFRVILISRESEKVKGACGLCVQRMGARAGVLWITGAGYGKGKGQTEAWLTGVLEGS